MTVPTQDYVWQQGEDGEISLVYKDSASQPIDLTGWSLRMDIAATSGRLYTFNSVTIDDLNADEILDDSDTTIEATLGADGSIYISVPREETLPGGTLYDYLDQALSYDIFLRDAQTTPKQKKILKGTITIERSVTLWR